MVIGNALNVIPFSAIGSKLNPTFKDDSSGSISFWIKAGGSTNGTFEMDSSIAGNRIEIIITATGIPSIVFRQFSGGPVVTRLYSYPTIPLSTWNHICVTSNGSLIRIYFNGIQQAVTPNLGSNTGQWFHDVFGGDKTFRTAGGEDILDETGIWSRELTATEVSDLHALGVGLYIDPTQNFPSTGTPISTSLRGIWHFDEYFGSTASDSSSNGNDLTLTGSFSWVTGHVPYPGPPPVSLSPGVIDFKDIDGNISTLIPDIGWKYEDNLNEVNEATFIFSGTGELRRSLIDINSEVLIYEEGFLKFKGLIDDIETFEGGGLNVHASGYEVWTAKENGNYTSSPYTATPSATIYSDLISESTKLSAGTIETGTNVDFRIEVSDSIWNGISDLSRKVGQDIDIDYSANQINILNNRGQQTSKATLNSGIEIGDVEITKSFPLGNRIIVYGKGEGNARIKSEPTHGIDAPSQAQYGVITKVIQDRTVTTTTEANLLADAEVARLKDPIKIYEFNLFVPLSVIAGDVLTINAPSQGVTNEEVKVVQVSKGVKMRDSFVNLKVTNKNFARLIKNRDQLRAELEKNSRNQDTYEIYGEEYANTTEATTIAGHTVNADCIGDYCVGGTRFMGESICLLGSAFFDDELVVPLICTGGFVGLGASCVEFETDIDMCGRCIKNVNTLNSSGIISNTISSLEYTSTGQMYLNPPCNGVVIHNTSFSQSRWSLYINDNLCVGGLKFATVPYGENKKIGYGAIESPEIWFSELCSSQLICGCREIGLDERFIETTTINENNPLNVSLTETSESKGLYVEKYNNKIIVKEKDNGKSDASFDLVISAKRKGYENIRYDTSVFDNETETWFNEKNIEKEKDKVKKNILEMYEISKEIVKIAWEQSDEYKRAKKFYDKYKGKKWITQLK
jgi:hypothetical protein